MKKVLILLSSALFILSVSACGPKKSAYRQVYEKAKQREVATQQQDSAQTPPTGGVVVSREPIADIQLRRERLEALKGEDSAMLKTYNVVVGSFQNHTNAYSLKERLQAQGYTPVLGQNEAGMLRVIITSFDNRKDAEVSRDQVKSRFSPDFQDAWILEKIH
jgi:Sporulation related domain.